MARLGYNRFGIGKQSLRSRRYERIVADGALRIVHDLAQQATELFQHLSHACLIEKVGIMDEPKAKALGPFCDVESEVKHRLVIGLDNALGRQPAQLDGGLVYVLHVEEHLKKGRAAQVSLGLELL